MYQAVDTLKTAADTMNAAAANTMNAAADTMNAAAANTMGAAASTSATANTAGNAAVSSSLTGLWSTMGWFPRAIVFILVIMAIFVIAVTIAKLYRFIRMGRSTRKFAPEFSSNLKERNISGALDLVRQYEKHSHVAKVLGVSLREVRSLISGGDTESDKGDKDIVKSDEVNGMFGKGRMSDDAIETAQRAVEREQVLLASDMKSGLGVMATVGATAPFVGLLGTVLGVIDAFTGLAMSGGGIAAVSAGIAEALITTAAGLLVAIPSVWLYNYFNSRLDTLFSELSYAGREMVDWMMGNGSFNLEEEAAIAAEGGFGNETGEVEGLDLNENSNESEEAKKEKG